ncbi:hypothetical protein OIU91_07740 [Streptomyces sp. NBC_01456]|uniref:hypothetical protein n=1 Tax=unclassified Streptomyces TaxID=2593676 RepID=UPI002E2FB2A3|nr:MULTISPECIES: hypothetical protein [unclassified Streptomyces]
MAQQQAQERHGTPAAWMPTDLTVGRHGAGPWSAVVPVPLTIAIARYACAASLTDRPAREGAR